MYSTVIPRQTDKVKWQGVIGYKMAVLQKCFEGIIRNTGDFQTSFDKGDRGYFFRIVVCSQMNLNNQSIFNPIDLIKTNQQTKKVTLVIGDSGRGYEFSNFRIFLYPMTPTTVLLLVIKLEKQNFQCAFSAKIGGHRDIQLN